jgi:lipoprotein signal peptidase
MDTTTKLVLALPPFLHDGRQLVHDRPGAWALAGLGASLLVAGFAVARPDYRLPAAMLLGGTVCNLSWVAFADGGPDPFVAYLGSGESLDRYAFNLADVAVAAGAAWAVARLLLDLCRWPLRRMVTR